jgi:hypothetical protein
MQFDRPCSIIFWFSIQNNLQLWTLAGAWRVDLSLWCRYCENRRATSLIPGQDLRPTINNILTITTETWAANTFVSANLARRDVWSQSWLMLQRFWYKWCWLRRSWWSDPAGVTKLWKFNHISTVLFGSSQVDVLNSSSASTFNLRPKAFCLIESLLVQHRFRQS